VSPDGKSVVFVASAQNKFQLWLRTLSSVDTHPIPGTEDGTFPFWSPDSRYIGFFANGKLKKVLAAGGPPLVLCDVASGRGGAWNRDNVIIFGATAGQLQRVSAAGGVPQPASVVDKEYGESSHRFPSFLPDVVTFCTPALSVPAVRLRNLRESVWARSTRWTRPQ
jgi:Tol biopolymer transport system component